MSLPSSPAIKPREPEELLADLVLHGIRTKFETVVRSAIVRSLKSGHGVPPLKDLLMGVVGWEGGADFSVWDEDEDETIGESLVESDLEMDALPEETEGPAEDAGPWQPATLPGEGGVQFAQAWFTGDVDF